MPETAATKRPILPFYLLADVSYSMAGAKLQAANQILPELATAVASSPALRDKIRFGVLTFSDVAKVILPQCDLGAISQLPVFGLEGGTSFAAAFREVKATIDADVAQLKLDNFAVHRPAVFFLTDGDPVSDEDGQWQDAWKVLMSPKSRPNVIPFGVEGADRSILESLVIPPMRGFFQADGSTPQQVIKTLTEVLIKSVLESATEMQSGGLNFGQVLKDVAEETEEVDTIEGDPDGDFI